VGYRITNRFDGYGPIPGLEGPFQYASGRILYYDPKQGHYWDPRTDFYLDHEEIEAEHNYLINKLAS
jgi:hypothetical protein